MFEKNLEILKKMGYDETLLNGEVFEIEKTRDEYESFKYKKNDKNIYINSLYNTKKEIDILLNELNFDKDTLFIVYGLGMGYHIEEIFNRMTQNSYIFVIEKDKDILTTFMKNKDFSKIINNNTRYFFGNEEEIIKKIHPSMISIKILGISSNCVDIILNSYRRIYGMEHIYKINNEIIEAVKYGFFALGNDVQDTIDGFENYIRNIKELIKSPKVDSVKDKYINRPAIIVSAGPSLDKNVRLLKNAEGKALILATDAVLSTLEKHDIVPDAVFTVERIMKTYEAFYKDKNINKNIVFIAPSVVRPEIFKTLKENKKLVFLKNGEGPSMWVTKKIIKENRYLVAGASCAHSAFSFSKHVGANPIIFVGQDLAYTKDGITHGSNVEIKGKENVEKSTIFVNGINGEKLPTNWALKNFLIWFEKEILKDNSSREYIDATEGGAFKKGTKLMKLEEVIEKYCTEDIDRLYNILPEGLELDRKYIESFTALNELKNDVKDLLFKCKKHNIKVKRYMKKYFENYESVDKDTLDKGLDILKTIIVIDRKIIYNELFVALFQPLLTTAVIEVRKLECKITTEVIKENMNIQLKMNKNIKLGCKIMLKVISKLKKEILNDDDYIKLVSNNGGK